MNKRQLNDALRRASQQLPPTNADYAAHAPVQRLEVHDHITRQVPALRRPRRPWVPLVAVCLLLAIGGGIWYYWWQNLMTWSTVYLSVNPAFSIELNRRDKVLEVDDETDDAEPLLEGRSYEGWDLEPTLSALLSDLEGAGYDLENAQIRVESENDDRATVLELRAKAMLPTGVPLDPETTQPVEPTPAPGVTEPPGVPLATPEPTHHDGAPAGWERLSPREAKDIVLDREPTAEIRQAKLEEDDGVWYYDIEVYMAGEKYDVEVEAVTGEILKWEWDD